MFTPPRSPRTYFFYADQAQWRYFLVVALFEIFRTLRLTPQEIYQAILPAIQDEINFLTLTGEVSSAALRELIKTRDDPNQRLTYIQNRHFECDHELMFASERRNYTNYAGQPFKNWIRTIYAGHENSQIRNQLQLGREMLQRRLSEIDLPQIATLQL
jgi:hypothetical protein